MSETVKGTALVTGASAGLGLELAQLFAKDGHSLVLVARRRDRLEALAKQLGEQHGVHVRVVAADLTSPKAPKAIFDELASVPVDFLVNNAGFGDGGAFVDRPLEKALEMVQVNITALTELTHRFLPAMIQRKRGRVLNIASTAGFQPGPYMAVYYATKAYVLHFTEALAEELQGTGVTATASCPGATATEFATVAGTANSANFKKKPVMAADVVAKGAYKAMHKGTITAVHGALNSMLVQGLRVSPRFLTRSIAAKLNKDA